ncbi:MAG TPA: immune inhibitor A domain-containing protein [Actinomycetota bacterium]|nr:immune inhibitor A domain-containing protein [Actinomycetota bacterium]
MIRKRIGLLVAVMAILAAPAVPQALSLAAPPEGISVEASYVSSTGWVKPGEVYPFKVIVRGGKTAASNVRINVALPPSASFVSSTPAPAIAAPRAASFTIPTVAPNTTTRIVIQARAASLTEDPEIIWKDLSATATMMIGPQEAGTSVTHGPRVTTLESARYGDRPFPILMVEYQDVKHCTGEGEPYAECTGNHTAEKFEQAVNSKTSGESVWHLFQDISLGQLHPKGTVPSAGKGTVPFEGVGGRKWSTPAPSGTCMGVTLAGADGTPAYPNRIEDGWYVLPGQQAYYGSDKVGHGLGRSLTGVEALGGIDAGCGPTGKLVYDSALAADPDLDYNDFDTDRDGVVDFTMVIFAGDGGNGSTTPTGLNNIWPHSSDLRSYFTSPDGQSGYISQDQLRDTLERPLWFTDATKTKTTTKNMGDALKAFVRVGPYNVNPEPSAEKISVIAHEYGHSLGLPDFYSTGGRSTFGSWELMAGDHAQYSTVFARQDLGWVVPREATDGEYKLRESKIDINEIHWKRPDGTPYVLKGPNIHNADVLRVGIPTDPLLDKAPSGKHVWHSGAGNDFDCPLNGGRGLLVRVPEAASVSEGSSMTLSMKSWYEIEWD